MVIQTIILAPHLRACEILFSKINFNKYFGKILSVLVADYWCRKYFEMGEGPCVLRSILVEFSFGSLLCNFFSLIPGFAKVG